MIKLRTALKQFRVGLHLKQSEMAQQMGVGRTVYGYVERGVRDGTLDFWNRLQRTYNVPDEEMWKLQKLDKERCSE